MKEVIQINNERYNIQGWKYEISYDKWNFVKNFLRDFKESRMIRIELLNWGLFSDKFKGF